MTEDLHPAGSHGAHQVDGIRIHRLEAVKQTDRNREEGREHNEHHLREDAVAKPQHQERRDRHRRNRLGYNQQGVQRFAQTSEQVHQQGNDKTQDNAQHQSEERLEQGNPRMHHQQWQIPEKGPHHLHRGRQHEAGHQLRQGDSLPQNHQQSDRRDAVKFIGDAL